MKMLPKTLVVLLALFVVTQAHAMRWYSPSTGSWFSRDPIGELGFQRLSTKQSGRIRREDGNLYHFIRNSPVNGIDVLGLEDNIWGYCCCGKAGRISAKPIPTGVRRCSADSTVEGVDHGWLEIDGWSADFNTDGSIWWSTGTVNIPTDYAKKDSKKCEDVLLSLCRYDFKKFRANVKAGAEKDKANPPTYTVIPFIGDQCFSWVNGIIGRAMQKSGPCGGEASAE